MNKITIKELKKQLFNDIKNNKDVLIIDNVYYYYYSSEKSIAFLGTYSLVNDNIKLMTTKISMKAFIKELKNIKKINIKRYKSMNDIQRNVLIKEFKASKFY